MSSQQRYARNRNTLSREDQERLAGARVVILGLGGLGGGVCEMLARVGVGHLTLVDGDRFEESNLNRQLLSREDNLNRSKAGEAAERLKAVNSLVRVRVIRAFAREESIADMIRDAHVVMDCLDTIDGRFLVGAVAGELGIPVVSGAIAGVTGQVMVIYPGDKGFEAIYGPRPEMGTSEKGKGVEQETGNLAHTAMFVASLQVSECLKVLVDRGQVLRNRLLIADLWENSVDIVTLD